MKGVLEGRTKWHVEQEDCVEAMRRLPAESMDSVVCDPPYGLEFMGKEWDRLGGSVLDEPASVGGFQDGAGGNPFSRSRNGYGIGNTMQSWHEAWAREALRVLKPGGHLLAFSGTRTYHRLACALEDAGFEIRDKIEWCYFNGFPKSLDVSKAIDKHFGKDGERKLVGWKEAGLHGGSGETVGRFTALPQNAPDPETGLVPVTAPATPEAAKWQGWGTALKPAHEPIVVARKSLVGTVAENVLRYGTGTLNVDRTRVAVGGERVVAGPANPEKRVGVVGKDLGFSRNDAETFRRAQQESLERANTLGRWPANFLLGHSPACERVGEKRAKGGNNPTGADDFVRRGGIFGEGVTPPGKYAAHADSDGMETVPEYRCVEGCPVLELDRQSGETTAGVRPAYRGPGTAGYHGWPTGTRDGVRVEYDAGTASRFFHQFQLTPREIEEIAFIYQAKASRSEREAGLDGLEPKNFGMSGGANVAIDAGEDVYDNEPGAIGLNVVKKVRNMHPTVKPIALMRHLCRLVTPPGGVVLDPFSGSGSTGIAARLEGFRFIGIEKEPEYVDIARRRIAHWEATPPTDAPLSLARVAATRQSAEDVL